MSTRLQLEGQDLETLLEQVQEEYGSRARIVEAEKTRSGGVGGFFAKEVFAMTVELDEEGLETEVPETPAELLEGKAHTAATLLDLAEAASRNEVSTTSASFGDVLDRITRSNGITAEEDEEFVEFTGAPAVEKSRKPRPSRPPMRSVWVGSDQEAGAGTQVPAPRPALEQTADMTPAPSTKRTPAVTSAPVASQAADTPTAERAPKSAARPAAQKQPITPKKPAAKRKPVAKRKPPAKRKPAAKKAAPTTAPRTPAARTTTARTTKPRAKAPSTRTANRNTTGTKATGRTTPATPKTAAAATTQARSGTIAARLLALGLPEHLLPTGHGELYRRLVTSLEAAPVATAPDLGPGMVLLIIGPAAEALETAEKVSKDLELDAEGVVLCAPETTAKLVPATRRATGPYKLAAKIEAATKRLRPLVIAVDERVAGTESAARHGWQTGVQALCPRGTRWGVVRATTKPTDLARWSERVGGLDGLCVLGVEDSADPATALSAGVPVARLDERAATPALWASLLCERLG